MPGRTEALNGAHILVCEDEPFIALELSLSVTEAEGWVVGPAASIAQAKALLGEDISGAILDVNLVDGEITPIAEYLLKRGIPVIIQTGVGLPSALQERHPDLRVFLKPVSTQVLIRELAVRLEAALPRRSCD